MLYPLSKQNFEPPKPSGSLNLGRPSRRHAWSPSMSCNQAWLEEK